MNTFASQGVAQHDVKFAAPFLTLVFIADSWSQSVVYDTALPNAFFSNLIRYINSLALCAIVEQMARMIAESELDAKDALAGFRGWANQTMFVVESTLRGLGVFEGLWGHSHGRCLFCTGMLRSSMDAEVVLDSHFMISERPSPQPSTPHPKPSTFTQHQDPARPTALELLLERQGLVGTSFLDVLPDEALKPSTR